MEETNDLDLHQNLGHVSLENKSKGRIEAFTTGSPHTNTIAINYEIESGFVAKDDLVPFRYSPVSSCVLPLQTRRRRWVSVKGSTRYGHRGLKCPLVRRLRMVREDTRVSNEDATCAWVAADEAVGCTRAFLTMWRSSRQLVCQGRPEPGLRINDISRTHWSQHFLTTHSERPN
ncbi:uncharacterized protein TNCV_2964841 [Trichonephila clavipes]|nr:uncharacterized protein TNCV_2964841 [Trichonephila clavipes]